MSRKFLRPLAASVSVLLSASQVHAALLDVVPEETVANILLAKPLAGDDLVIERASDETAHFAAHSSHRSHSSHQSHSSHSSHRSHYSSSF